MVAENATGLRNLFKLSSLASFEGQLGKWSRMDAELIAEHAAGIIATTGCPSGEVQTRLRLGQRPRGAGGGRQVAGDLRAGQLLPRADGPRAVASNGGSATGCSRSAASWTSRRWPPTTATTSPATPPTTTRRCCACRPARRCRIRTGSSSTATATTSSRLPRCAQIWDDEVPGACDSTLLIAERVQSYADVWAPRDRMPVFPVPEGHDQASWLRHEVDAGSAAGGSPPACRTATPSGPPTRSTSSATRASRPTS